MTIPRTIEECDRELAEYRKAMELVTRDGRAAVWDQLDRVLEIRFLLQTTGRKKVSSEPALPFTASGSDLAAPGKPAT